MKLEKGQKIENFTYLDAYGAGEKNLYEFAQGKKTVIVFLRYYGCTLCQVDMHNYMTQYKKFEDANAQLMVVLQSKPEVVSGEAPQGTFPFVIACDPEEKVYKQFEILPAKSKLAMAAGDIGGLLKKAKQASKLGYSHGQYEGNEQQLPAAFVLNEDCEILLAHYAKSVTDLPTVDRMLSAYDK